MITISEDIQKGFVEVQNVMTRAYAPYSKLLVGAALKVKRHDEYIVGCNVENASFGATICAERIAVGRAISTFGACEFEHLILGSTSPSGVIPPCGMCLQVLREFVAPDFKIYLGDAQSIHRLVDFKSLVPHSFDPNMLP